MLKKSIHYKVKHDFFMICRLYDFVSYLLQFLLLLLIGMVVPACYKGGKKMNIFFITGTSGAGKTTLINSLKLKLPKSSFEIYDFDEVGVPSNADTVWRQGTTDFWLTKAKENSAQKKSTIICGVTVPSEILSSSKKPDLPIYFGFIKVADEIIKQRLKARGWDDKLIQDNINWAHHLETEIKKQKDYLIVDSSLHVMPEQTADEFIKFIRLR
jgi:broad-specificity NMP kinase